MLGYCDDYCKFIGSIVKKVKTMFSDFSLNNDDLYQRGWLELIKAYYNYDANKGAKLTTYAHDAIYYGIIKEAVSQIDKGTSIDQTNKPEFISLDDTDLDIADEISVDFEDNFDDTSSVVRQILTDIEFKLLCTAFGVDCEQCADPKKLAGRFGMSVIEVKKAMENGKRKLRVLYGRE
ncbi:MAG: sigma factor [Oscillospiraceae bacterium]